MENQRSGSPVIDMNATDQDAVMQPNVRFSYVCIKKLDLKGCRLAFLHLGLKNIQIAMIVFLSQILLSFLIFIETSKTTVMSR